MAPAAAALISFRQLRGLLPEEDLSFREAAAWRAWHADPPGAVSAAQVPLARGFPRLLAAFAALEPVREAEMRAIRERLRAVIDANGISTGNVHV